MTKISKKTTLRELALLVGDCLRSDGIDAVLTGGGVVSIYTNNRYESYDLDFISFSPQEEISNSLLKIGFKKSEGRYYRHPRSDYYIEFPAPPLSIGNQPIERFNELQSEEGYLKLLTPTHCVMDRLAAYYYWNDRQSLDQAIWVAEEHTVDMIEVQKWSNEEGMSDKFKMFASLIKFDPES